MTLRLEDIERLHVGLLAVAVAVAFLTAWVSALSVLLGGAVMGGNFWIMRQLACRLLSAGHRQRPSVVVALLVGKFSLFLLLLGLLFWRVRLDPVGFTVGVTVLLVACVAVALRQQPVRA